MIFLMFTIFNINQFILKLYIFFKNKQKSKAAISIVIHQKCQNFIKSWESFNKRFIKVTVHFRGKHIINLYVYALNDDSSIQAINSFEDDLKKM